MRQFIVGLFDIVSHTSNFCIAVYRVLDQVFERIGAFHVLQDCIGDIGYIDAGLPAHPVGVSGLVAAAVHQLRAVPENLPGLKAHLLILALRVRHIGQQHCIVLGTGQAVLNFRLQRVVGIRRESPI